jgi:hypothetical protein
VVASSTGRTRRLHVSMGPPIPPSPTHIGHHLGAASAKVHLGVYLDYCCPFSAKAYRMLFGQVSLPLVFNPASHSHALSQPRHL